MSGPGLTPEELFGTGPERDLGHPEAQAELAHRLLGDPPPDRRRPDPNAPDVSDLRRELEL